MHLSAQICQFDLTRSNFRMQEVYVYVYDTIKFTCENITNIQLANGQLHESSKVLQDSNFVVTRMIIYY
jgi:hypothetical protein